MSRLLRRAAVVTATAALALSLGSAPANAFPPPGETMIVTSYYNSAGTLVGQDWWGCSYDPDGGSWGVLEGRKKFTFTPCQF